MATKSLASRVDWSSLANKLKPETVAAINVFRRKHAELAKSVQELKEQQITIDFSSYKNTLKNQQVVASAEKAILSFKPATLEISSQLAALNKAEAAAVKEAEQTAAHVNAQIKELNVMLENIETARPVTELLVDDVAKAVPGLDDTVAKMTKRGQWAVPGYYEKFGSFVVGF